VVSAAGSAELLLLLIIIITMLLVVVMGSSIFGYLQAAQLTWMTFVGPVFVCFLPTLFHT